MKTLLQSAREDMVEGKRLLALQPEGRRAILNAMRRKADEFRCYVDCDGVCDCGTREETADRHAARMFVLRTIQEVENGL